MTNLIDRTIGGTLLAFGVLLLALKGFFPTLSLEAFFRDLEFPISSLVILVVFGLYLISRGVWVKDAPVRKIKREDVELVSLAAHQLRTPAATISWYSELLLGQDADPLTDDQRSSVNQIAESARRLSNLVTALLDASHIELGPQYHDDNFFDAAELFNDTIKDLRSTADRKNILINVEIDSVLPMIACHPKVGSIVFQNVLSNAVKYTPEGGEIKCSLMGDKEKAKLIFSVEDNGIGIPLHDRPHIFERFYRAENAKEVDPIGSGLGLAMTKTLIDRSGGSISFKSNNDKGVTFTAILPFTCSA
jgi:signal transduction histidine kinase